MTITDREQGSASTENLCNLIYSNQRWLEALKRDESQNLAPIERPLFQLSTCSVVFRPQDLSYTALALNCSPCHHSVVAGKLFTKP